MGANILVGCGGSGIETLIRVNELLAEDGRWRHRVAKDIYYIVIDTEEAKLKKFEATVDFHLRGAERPLIISIELSKGVTNLQPLTYKHFVAPFEDGGNLKGQQRLYAHWWNRGPGEPFTAPWATPLYNGAGQCPPASYFLAWRNMKDIEKQFKTLIDQIRANAQGKERSAPLKNLNFCIVAGLAGGTGRGCWTLIAFKMRELFSKYHATATPLAFLFDASVHENVMQKHPDYRTAMEINSLTGISELSCWMRNIRGDASRKPVYFEYRLPDMEMPEQKDSDVLKVRLDRNVLNAAPVDSAYLVFRDSDRAFLEDNMAAHEMVGAAIYAAITRSKISGEKINNNFPYLGIGTATFEIPSSTIRKYFEGLARVKVLRLMRKQDEEVQDDVDGAESTFLDKTRLLVGLNKMDRSAFKADNQGNLLQRACYFLLESLANKIEALHEALKEDDIEGVAEIARSLARPDERDALDAAKEAVTKAFGAINPDPNAQFISCLEKLYEKTQSIAAMLLFIQGVNNRLRDTLASMPPADRQWLGEDGDLEKLVADYKGKEFLLLGKRYNETEINVVMDKTPNAILFAHYEAFKEALLEAYSPLMQLTERLQGKASRMISILSGEIEARLRNELKGLAGSESDEDAFRQLFADPEAPEKGVPHQSETERFYKRIIKPLLTQSEAMALLTGKITLRPQLRKMVLDAMLDRSSDPKWGNSFDPSTSQEYFVKELETRVRENGVLPENFMEENFSIEMVLSKIREAWQNRLVNLINDNDAYKNAEDRLEAFFGVKPGRTNNQIDIPMPKDFLIQMAISLGRSCQPYWQVADDEIKERQVTVFSPTGLSDAIAKDKTAKKEIGEAKIELCMPEKGTNEWEGSNPFLMLAFSSYQLKSLVKETDNSLNILSLGYWSRGELLKWLHKCEDPKGTSILSFTSGNKGVGYVDPIYVHEELLSSMRWKPWMTMKSEDNLELNRGLDALIYALMEPAEDSRIKAELEKLKWQCPLIRDTGKEKYVFTRKIYKIAEDGEFRDDPGCDWKSKSNICVSIWKVLALLMGDADKAKSKKAEKGPNWTNQILRERKIFWEKIAPRIGCAPGSDDYKFLKRALERFLVTKKDHSETDDRSTWEKLILRLEEEF